MSLDDNVEENTLVGERCPSCRKKTIFRYLGSRAILDEETYGFPLYNCDLCYSSVSLIGIEKFNREYKPTSEE